jgi:hypothetical protein
MRLVSGLYRTVGTLVASVALLCSMASLAPAALRVPQVPVLGGTLQGYFNGVGESINVLTDQVNAQVFHSSVSGNATFTLMIELTASAAANNIGIYNAGLGAPPLNLLFPGAAAAGWFVTAHFSGGNVVVTLFDQNSIIQGQNIYAGVPGNNFGFYIQGPGGTFYSQDARNPGGLAQVLTYLGTGQNFGDWWECFEDSGVGASDRDFDDAVLLLQSVAPTAVESNTWGKIKSLYRK